MSRDKYKILVINQPDLVQPEGWVSCVIPPGKMPSKYEQSAQSPWDIIEADENPIEAYPKTKKNKKNKDVKNPQDFQIYKNGKFKKAKRHDIMKDHKQKVPKPKKWPHPPLKGGSLIWDYGTGRTYSTPQAALDALIAYWAFSQIDSNQYVRGYGTATYTDTNYVLHVVDVNVGYGDQELIFDIDEGADITFSSGYATIIGALDDTEYMVARATFDGLKIYCDDPDGFGVAVQEPEVGGDLPFDNVDRWEIKNCYIENTSPTSGVGVGFLAAGSIRSVLKSSIIEGFEFGTPTAEGIERTWTGFINILSSIIDAKRSAIYVNPREQQGGGCAYQQEIYMAHSVIKAPYGIERFGNSFSRTFVFNSIADVGFYVLYAPGSSLGFFLPVLSDGNCYNYGSNFAYDKTGAIDFATAQALVYTDEHSIIADPLLTKTEIFPPGRPSYFDYELDSTSPCWKAGVGVGYDGIDGWPIGRGVTDIGPWQETRCSIVDPLACGYCTVPDVVNSTGATPDEFDFVSDDEPQNQADFNQLVCLWISQVSDVIDEYCEKSWPLVETPDGIRRAATMMTSAVVNIARQRRKSPIIKINDFTVKAVEEEILTEETKEILDLYADPGKASVIPPAIGEEKYQGLGMGTLTACDIDQSSEDDPCD